MSNTDVPRFTGGVHIDRIHVTGDLEHKPIGTVFFRDAAEHGMVAAGASAHRPAGRKQTDDIYIRSKQVQSGMSAWMLEFDCCPPKLLQKHNAFGHNKLMDYVYDVFDGQTQKLGIPVDDETRNAWISGYPGLTCVHLTANFWCPEGIQELLINAIDENNECGKHRDEKTCITLGFASRRSKYHTVTVYAKAPVLENEWANPGPMQQSILRMARNSIRVEVKIYSQWLKRAGLDYVMRWKDVDINQIFFDVLAKYNIANSIQPLLTTDEQSFLTRAQRRLYTAWLNGSSIKDEYCRSTACKHIREVKTKTGLDMSGSRRPESLPTVNLAELLVPENIVPLPCWAEGSSYYWPPRAERTFAADPAV